jgi:hypothetical protein
MLHCANSEPGGKNRGLYCGKYPLMVVSAVFIQLKLRVITLHFVSENGYYAKLVIPRNKQFFHEITKFFMLLLRVAEFRWKPHLKTGI